MDEQIPEYPDLQPEEWIAGLFLSLRKGDTVYLNGRDRPFTVTKREWDDRESGYWRYTLSAYGTEYHGIVNPGAKSGTGNASISTFKTDAGAEILPGSATKSPDEPEQIVGAIRADDWLAEAGISLR